MKFYTQEQMVDKHVGTKGTPAREEYDEQVELMLVGEAIRKARQAQQLSQEQLGEMVGVQKAQISRLENGKNLTLASIVRLFKALNQRVTLDIPSVGRVALCSAARAPARGHTHPCRSRVPLWRSSSRLCSR